MRILALISTHKSLTLRLILTVKKIFCIIRFSNHVHDLYFTYQSHIWMTNMKFVIFVVTIFYFLPNREYRNGLINESHIYVN